MSPAHSWLLVLAIVVVAWGAVRVLEVIDEGICRLVAHLRQSWKVRQLQERQYDLARTRRSRVRALVKRVSRV